MPTIERVNRRGASGLPIGRCSSFDRGSPGCRTARARRFRTRRSRRNVSSRPRRIRRPGSRRRLALVHAFVQQGPRVEKVEQSPGRDRVEPAPQRLSPGRRRLVRSRHRRRTQGSREVSVLLTSARPIHPSLLGDRTRTHLRRPVDAPLPSWPAPASACLRTCGSFRREGAEPRVRSTRRGPRRDCARLVEIDIVPVLMSAMVWGNDPAIH